MEPTLANILAYNRNPHLTKFCTERLEALINEGVYHSDIDELSTCIIDKLTAYKDKHGVRKVMVGMSGGIDSALTAALFKKAGYFVYGITMPIHQKPEETGLAWEAMDTLGVESLEINLSRAYEGMYNEFQQFDNTLINDRSAKRRGNIKARLRMMTLYNFASLHGGIVASTDNFSELAAGFWTLHGDVGDVAPIQSLTKSWEVPALAELMGVPKSIIQATPTDGLGISHSDESQLGFSYLAFDVMLLSLMTTGIDEYAIDEGSARMLNAIKSRIKNTSFKRNNPYNLDHPKFEDRFDLLAKLDDSLE